MNKPDTLEASQLMALWSGNDVGIEERRRDQHAWMRVVQPLWDWSKYDYRESKAPKEFYVSLDQHGVPYRVLHSEAARDGLITMKVREIIDP